MFGFTDPIDAKNAIVVPGPLIGDISGKIGGSVFAKNKGGLYVKSFSVPTNPNTTLQAEVRSTWTVLTNAWWDILTSTQRTGWVDLAAANPVLNRLGQSIFLSGQNMYIRYNQSRILALETRDDDAPAAFVQSAEDPAFTIDDIDPGAPSFDIAFDDTLAWASADNASMLVYQGQTVSVGRARFHGPYRILGVIPGNSITPPTSPVAFTSPAWTLTSPGKAWAQAILIEGDRFPSTRMTDGPFSI